MKNNHQSFNRPSARWDKSNRAASRNSENGIALVITLVLLSIITFMAITLLVVTRSEKSSVSTNQDQTTATYVNDAAIENFKMLFTAPTLAFSNSYNYDFVVSTNFINPGGFITAGLARQALTNVNYRYANGNPISQSDNYENLQHLFYAARPPVFITNRLAPPYGSNEFRYWLDINRNGQADETGMLPVIGVNGPVIGTNGLVLSNFFAGDPQWVGVLEKPGFPHSASNRFIGRYAYLGVPLSQTLDLNYIHNYAKAISPLMSQGSDGFFRNMGVGTWEMNLAAFLVDLNTNIWQPAIDPYRYFALGPTYLQANRGLAFNDALSLLRYRYGNNYRNLSSVQMMFGPKGSTAFLQDGIDGYTSGAAATNTAWKERDLPTQLGWSGADNTNYFFTPQELFDSNKTRNGPGPTLSDRLIASTTSSNTYDRNTFFRMLAQISTDSAPETDRINLNYRNLDDNGIVIPNAATNFIPWVPTHFFTNVAIRLMANAGFAVGPFGSTTNCLVLDSQGRTNLHIPIWPTNYYTPAVHRLLQVAANIYDATTNRTFGAANTTNGFPTVFRPIFEPPAGRAVNQISITGYEEVQDTSLLTAPMRDLSEPASRNSLKTRDMVYGFPVIVGAKKGLPNFNEFSMETLVSVTRKLRFDAAVPRDPSVIRPHTTNQMFVVSVSNVFGIEGWNSYSNVYPRPLQIIIGCDMTAVITNELGGTPLLNNRFAFATNQTVPAWDGFRDVNHANSSFKIPFPPSSSHFHFLSNSTYSQVQGGFVPLTGRFDQPPNALPHWWLQLNSRLRFILVDTGVNPNRIVDYVNLASSDPPVDITYELMQNGGCSDTYNPPQPGPVPDGLLWCTNRVTPLGLPFGTRLQIDVSRGLFDADWKKALTVFPGGSGLNDESAAKAFFAYNLLGRASPEYSQRLYVTNVFYSPYNPTRNLYINTSWQANDPLVHYMIGDLQDNQNLQSTNRVLTASLNKMANIGRINDRYEPWGNISAGNSQSKTAFALEVKDPMVTRSDDWDFPTNKLATIGAMGRIHRGTPWQTLYLKSTPVDITNWAKWTGNLQAITNFGQIDTNILNLPLTVTYPATNWTYDLLMTYPTNDWSIPEIFTTAFNDNAARGRLSVNQTNLAAWSALFSGIVALQADPKGSMMKAGAISNNPVVIEPVGTAGFTSPLWQLYAAINRVRSSTNFNGAFKKVGDILAVPEFSVESPFLNLTSVTDKNWSANDAACERLPQQTLSLLTLEKSPRYIIYSWGQALKPANKSIVTAGPAFGLCTNYQITAETATRTIVRLEGLPNNPHMVVEKFNVLPPD
jgi:hypothetical protein